MRRRSAILACGMAAIGAAGVVGASYVSMGTREAYERATADQRVRQPAEPTLRDLVRYAALAANGHNTQPWRFRITDDQIVIRPDFARRTPVVDPDDHHLWISLGCVAEALAIAAAASGRPAEARFDPANDGQIVVALGHGMPRSSFLFDAIPHRQTTRAEYDGRSVAVVDSRALQDAAAAVVSTDLVLATDRSAMDRLRDLVVAANTEQMADAAFVAELKRWVRYNPHEALQAGDGLYAAATGNPVLPGWLAPTLFDLAFRTNPENDRYARQIRGSAGIAIFLANNPTPDGWIGVGRAYQRFVLQTTALGLRLSFLNQPVEVARFRPELADVIGAPGRRADLVVRYGYGPRLPFSPRRPVAQVLA